MTPIHWFFWGVVAVVAVCAVVAFVQVWREEREIAQRKRAWWSEHDKLEPR